MTTVMSLEARIRTKAREELNKRLDVMFNPVTTISRYYGDSSSDRRADSKFVHIMGNRTRKVPQPAADAIEEKVLDIRQLLTEARNIIYNAEVAICEQAAVDAFERKVDGLQDQLDELRDVVESLPQQ